MNENTDFEQDYWTRHPKVFTKKSYFFQVNEMVSLL